MKTCKQTQGYLIYEIEAVRNGFKAFEFRLPLEVCRVIGIYISIAQIAPLRGELCVKFSEGTSAPLTRFQARAFSGLPKKKISYIKLDEHTTPACLLSGYYQDKSGFASITHKVKIYLRVLKVGELEN